MTQKYRCESKDKSVSITYEEECSLYVLAEKFHKEFPNIVKFTISTMLDDIHWCDKHFYSVCNNSVVEITSYLGIRFFYDDKVKVIQRS